MRWLTWNVGWEVAKSDSNWLHWKLTYLTNTRWWLLEDIIASLGNYLPPNFPKHRLKYQYWGFVIPVWEDAYDDCRYDVSLGIFHYLWYGEYQVSGSFHFRLTGKVIWKMIQSASSKKKKKISGVSIRIRCPCRCLVLNFVTAKKLLPLMQDYFFLCITSTNFCFLSSGQNVVI